MAGIDVGSGGKRRATNSDINMIPFIDLLMVTISFLLITAVWASSSRIDVDAKKPGEVGCGEDCPPQSAMLHVTVTDNDFKLVWRDKSTVISELSVPKTPIEVGEGGMRTVRFPDLAASIKKEWDAHGGHKDPSDRAIDNAVLHTSNNTTFREIVAVLDAINSARRDLKMPDGSVAKVAALSPTFSALEK